MCLRGLAFARPKAVPNPQKICLPHSPEPRLPDLSLICALFPYSSSIPRGLVESLPNHYFAAQVDSVAFKIGNFQIYWYGILVAAGFLIALRTASTRAMRVGFTADSVYSLAPWILIGTVIGARTLYVFSYWDEQFAGRPWYTIFNIRSGLVFYGGLIGASLAGIVYCWKNKVHLWRMADVLAPSIALGHAFGRVGCFMTGCCFGTKCDLPWAVTFPQDHATHGVPVHPTQLYEAGLNLALYFGLAWLFRRRKFDGQVFAVYLAVYACIRAFTEMFRGDYEKFYLGGVLTPGQTVSILIFLAGLFVWWKQRGAHVPSSLKTA